LQPLFLTGAFVSLVAFVLSWFIPEVPLRKTVTSEGLGESFAAPNDASSLRELEAKAATLAQRKNRHHVYEELGRGSGVSLTADGMWALPRVDELGPATREALAARVAGDRERLSPIFRGLREDGLIAMDETSGEPVYTLSESGRSTVDALLTARCE